MARTREHAGTMTGRTPTGLPALAGLALLTGVIAIASAPVPVLLATEADRPEPAKTQPAKAETAEAPAPSDGTEPKSDPKPWAYTSPVRPEVPTLKDAARVRNPVDAFLLARLERAGLGFAPEADPVTLLRRVHFDLTGLPPSAAEIEAFLKDDRSDAFERVVDKLLASPRYGERWAQHWLDLVRYAETNGFKADERRPNAWRYRDWVVDSLNADKPYDRFLHEQLAGDEMFPDSVEARIATGFLRHYPDESNAINLDQRRQEILNDITDTVSSAVLGLTLGCARCHDHKFDPLLQADYYRIQSFFAGLLPDDKTPARADDLALLTKSPASDDPRAAALRKEMEKIEADAGKRLAAGRRRRFQPEHLAMYDKPEEQRSPLERQIAHMVGLQVEGDRSERMKKMSADEARKFKAMEDELSAMTGAARSSTEVPTIMGMTEVGPQAPETRILKRGEWRKPAAEVKPGWIEIMDATEATIPTPAPGAKTSGRRTVLAKWLTRPDNPLTARVIVNRMWQHHFGRGIVGTTSDFGVQGEPPTHPELIDWLATELVAGKWSLKHIHRLMVTSTAWRQSSRARPDGLRTDSENRLLWRANRRRLEGEALRDAMLVAAGRLNLKAHGPGVCTELPAELGKVDDWKPHPDPAERDRRSIWVFAKRNLRNPIFTVFDAPDGNEACSRRNCTTTAPQALMLLNDSVVLKMAADFAARVQKTAGADASVEVLVTTAWRDALGRIPTAAEARPCVEFLTRAGTGKARTAALADLCHVLFNANEFAYVD